MGCTVLIKIRPRFTKYSLELINKIKNNVSNRVKMASPIYISIWLLTCFTVVYATLLLGGGVVLSIKTTLLSNNFKTLLFHDQLFAHFNLNIWGGGGGRWQSWLSISS